MVCTYSTKETRNTSYMTLQTNIKSLVTDWISSQFADDGADPLNRNAAQVPSRSSRSEFTDEDEGEGAESSGRLSLRDTGKGL